MIDCYRAFVKTIVAAGEESGSGLVRAALNEEESFTDQSGCSDGEGTQGWNGQPVGVAILVWLSLEVGIGTEEKGMGIPWLVWQVGEYGGSFIVEENAYRSSGPSTSCFPLSSAWILRRVSWLTRRRLFGCGW